MAVMLQFPLGDVVVDLYDEGEPSRICESFTRLCAGKYYHGCLVYQVQKGSQTGDPRNGPRAVARPITKRRARFIRHTPTDDRQKHDRAGFAQCQYGLAGNDTCTARSSSSRCAMRIWTIWIVVVTWLSGKWRRV